MSEYTFSAKGKKLGRIASDVAHILMGKNLATFVRNKAPKVSVTITDASGLDFMEKKMKHLTHKNYSGYPGGLRVQDAKEVIAKKGYRELIIKAVDGMLPKNSLRRAMLKNLTVTE